MISMLITFWEFFSISPTEKSTRRAATATAEPLDDPPGTLSKAIGFIGVP